MHKSFWSLSGLALSYLSESLTARTPSQAPETASLLLLEVPRGPGLQYQWWPLSTEIEILWE